MAEIVLNQLDKTYPGGVQAVRQFSLAIPDGALAVLVGPSGCGKTTLLRMVAGLERVTGGTIAFDGRDVTQAPPRDRHVAMVFQHYALYPHMSVYDNMAFGLKLRKVARPEIDARVRETAALLTLTDVLEEKPATLSGGQCQRVAVGRALVQRPAVFLFDEPLSSLDAPLRAQARLDIRKLQRQFRTTMLYVTHDQAEAMTLGDQVTVMEEGTGRQTADPKTLYEKPANLFVARFMGCPPMNLIRGRLISQNGTLSFALDETIFCPIPEQRRAGLETHLGRPVFLGIRPEHVLVGDTSSDHRSPLRVQLDEVESLGAETWLHINVNGTALVSRTMSAADLLPGKELVVTMDMAKAHFFDEAGGQAIG